MNYQRSDYMTRPQDKALCILINEAIKDENKAPADYEEIISELVDTGQINQRREDKIRDIISQEKSHERDFIRFAVEIGCPISQNKYITRA